MKNIVIVGSGGIAVETKYIIDDINSQREEWNLLGFIDNWGKPQGEVIVEDKGVIGTIDELNSMKNEIYAIVSIGDPQRIKDAALKINNRNIQFANLIHPTASVHKTVKIGYGNIIAFTSFISCNIEIGNFNLFNIKTVIGHDTVIGSFNVFNPNILISGNAVIGNENFFGLNSSVLQKKHIGDKNRIAAYSFVNRNIKDDGRYMGMPLKAMQLPEILK